MKAPRKIESLDVFKAYRTLFNEMYLGLRLPDREITVIESLTGGYTVSLCTPYNQEEERKRSGSGAGAVILEWEAADKVEAVYLINKYCFRKYYWNYDQKPIRDTAPPAQR